MPQPDRRDRLGRVRRPEQDVFQPLDPASPSVVVRLRVPQALVERLDEAAAARGMTRSEAIRQAVEAWLVE